MALGVSGRGIVEARRQTRAIDSVGDGTIDPTLGGRTILGVTTEEPISLTHAHTRGVDTRVGTGVGLTSAARVAIRTHTHTRRVADEAAVQTSIGNHRLAIITRKR